MCLGDRDTPESDESDWVKSESQSVKLESEPEDETLSNFSESSADLVRRDPIRYWLRRESPDPAIYIHPVQTPILDVFVERFVDAFAPEVAASIGTSSALRAAASVRIFSPLLYYAFESVSITFFGQAIDERRIVLTGLTYYQRLLRQLQNALFDPEQSRSEAVMAVTILLMAFESIQFTSETALVTRCVGALKLIEYRGPHSHRFGLEHLCFTELLPYWVSTALFLRRPSFLARSEWKTIPWSARDTPKDIMEMLLEKVVDLPAIMHRHDLCATAIRTKSHPDEYISDQQEKLWNTIARFEEDMRQWKRLWADAYPAGQAIEVDSQGDDPFPVFKQLDPTGTRFITPRTLVYPDPQLARTLGMYYAAMILLATTDTRPSGGITRSQIYNYACQICRTMEYYIRNVPGNHINRMAFPLRIAFDALPEASLERRFVGEVFHLVQRRHTLKSWGEFIFGDNRILAER